MKIKLTRSGGLTGKKMSAEIDSGLTEKEWSGLLEQIGAETPGPDKRSKDAFYYTLQGGNEAGIPVNPALVPEKYSALFQTLFNELKVE